MTREVYSRLRLEGALVTQGPLHVGGHGESTDADLPLARNGAGDFCVPGSSLAGCLRRWTEAAFDADLSALAWGQPSGVAGGVLVADAAVQGAIPEFQSGVCIDLRSGTLAERICQERAVLPRGCRLGLDLTLEVPSSAERPRLLALMGGLKRALEQGEVRLGAGKTRGCGRVMLAGGVLREELLGTRAGLLAFLAGGQGPLPEDAVAQALAQHPPKPRPRIDFAIRWKAQGPVMVKAAHGGVAVDLLPLVGSVEGLVAPVLPGASIKGAMRAQAERILRTLFVDAEVPLVREVFGDHGKMGAMAVEECYASKHLPPEQWRSIATAGKSEELRTALDTAGLRSWGEAYRVAVDRWTGAAVANVLFAVLEPTDTEWEPMRATLDLSRLSEGNARGAAVALLLMTLRDLALGKFALGFGANRGMGAVQVEAVELTAHDTTEPLPTGSMVLQRGRIGDMAAGARAALDAAWREWLRAARKGAGV